MGAIDTTSADYLSGHKQACQQVLGALWAVYEDRPRDCSPLRAQGWSDAFDAAFGTAVDEHAGTHGPDDTFTE